MLSAVVECTVRLVEAVIEPFVARITVMPSASPVAAPAVVMLAVADTVLVHATWLVRSCPEPSANRPTAWNACIAPTRITGSIGVMLIETRGAVVDVVVLEVVVIDVEVVDEEVVDVVVRVVDVVLVVATVDDVDTVIVVVLETRVVLVDDVTVVTVVDTRLVDVV